MSAFKVGDLALVLPSKYDATDGIRRPWVGKTLRVVSVPTNWWVMLDTDKYGGTAFENAYLRKIDPPNKDEPITDFVPCEPEFFQDLMKRVKQREGV